MKKSLTLVLTLLLAGLILPTTLTYAVSDQYREETVQKVHEQPAPEVRPEETRETSGDRIRTGVERERRDHRAEPATAVAPVKAKPAKVSRRAVSDPWILLLIIGAALLVIAIILAVVAAASVSFGAAWLSAIFWTLGGLALLAGLIWLIIELAT